LESRKQNNFADSLQIGERAEKELALIFKKRMSGFIDI